MKARLPQGFQNKGAGNMNDMVRQAQKVQEQIREKQAELETREYTVSAAGGMIELVMNGAHELKSVKLRPEVVDSDNVEDLEDVILSGVNAVVAKVDAECAAEMETVTGGLSMPGIL